MSRGNTAVNRSGDRRWLMGWIQRLCGLALFASVFLGTIGAFRKWGSDFPSATITTMAVLAAAGALLFGGGQLLMKISPRQNEERGEETQR